MPVRIRLRRIGRKKQPSYRLVVAESQTSRDGAYVEVVGFYNPLRKPAELRIDLGKIDYWIDKGAQPSETAASLIEKARKGGDDKVTVEPMGGTAAAEPAAVNAEQAVEEGAPEAVAEPAAAEPEPKPRRTRAKKAEAAEE